VVKAKFGLTEIAGLDIDAIVQSCNVQPCDKRVSVIEWIYSALSRTPNALDALVSREQVRLY